MKKVALFAVLLSLILTVGGCTKRQAVEAATITVSILPQKYFLEKITGDKFQVTCMLSKGSSPENYDPAMSSMMLLEKSTAYFFMGNLGFESAIKGKVKQFNPTIKMFDTSDGLELFVDEHHSHNGHPEADPHVWTSVPNVRVIARNMYDAVVALDPKNEAYYKENYRRFDRELVALHEQFSEQLDSLRGSAFIVWHPALSYFAHDYGLEQISMEYNGKEAHIKHLEERVSYAKKRGARVFLYQKETGTSQVETINSQLGTKLVEINPLGYDWEKEMRHIADALTK